ncbi:hypothetical protein HMPREF1204_04390, partial [Bacteroides fragilis HMW 615]
MTHIFQIPLEWIYKQINQVLLEL